MKDRDEGLRGVRERLEEAVASLGKPADAVDLGEKLEMVGIQIVDSEFDSFRPGELAEYVGAYLYVRNLELGLVPFPNPKEE